MKQAYSREFPSLYRGVVEDNQDPENLGRCKIRVPSVHGALTYPIDMLPWARPIVLSPLNEKRGSANLPDIGDIVWVLFEGSDRDAPVYLGGTYATGDIKPTKNIVDFYIEGEDRISYHREDRTYSIQVGDNIIKISKEGIQISGDLSIKGDLTVSGTATVGNLVILGSCNKECDCE